MNFGVCDFSRFVVTDWRLRRWRLWQLPLSFDVSAVRCRTSGAVQVAYISGLWLHYIYICVRRGYRFVCGQSPYDNLFGHLRPPSATLGRLRRCDSFAPIMTTPLREVTKPQTTPWRSLNRSIRWDAVPIVLGFCCNPSLDRGWISLTTIILAGINQFGNLD